MTSLAPTLSKASLNNLINFIFFQAVWFATIVGAAQGKPIYGFACLCCFAVVHHFMSVTARSDFVLAGVAVLLGFFIETVIIRTGILTYEHNLPFAQLAPAWILLLWANLALTLNGCLRWLQGRYLLAALLGASGGPLSYFGGLKLGAATTDLPLTIAMGFIAVTYALITPLLLLIARQMSGKEQPV